MIKKKTISYLNRLVFPSAVLYLILLFLESFNLKPVIKTNFFFWFFVTSFLILKSREVLIYLIEKLNKFNKSLDSSYEEIKVEVIKTSGLMIYFFRDTMLISKKILVLIDKERKLLLPIILFFGIIIDIFIFRFNSELVLVVLILLWAIIVRSFRLNCFVAFKVGFVFLLLCLILKMKNNNFIPSEKAAIWSYVFIFLGIIQSSINLLRKNENTA